ncbi:MAG: GTPase Era [Elusimicrobia bacterium]|nr:GTPase Era [Elusimicrobiota bacterium]
MAHRAGFVSILGLPNAGKSTLLNALLGRRLVSVSPKPQTTRHRILGILNTEDAQAVFVDTPGWLEKASDPLQESLRTEVKRAAREDADLAILVVEPRVPSPEALAALTQLVPKKVPLFLALNKRDIAKSETYLDAAAAAWTAALPQAVVFKVSALKGPGLPELRAAALAALPESPAFYDKEQLSDRWDRFFASEFVREQIFSLYSDEIPHACAVVIEEWKETPRRDLVWATVHVEKESQKGILIGKGGTALKRLTERAQASLEAFTGRKAVLEVWVKVRKDWRRDARSLKEFGYLDG